MMMKINKNLIILIAFCLLAGTPYLNAKDGEPEHLLDGTTLEFYYQNGSGISMDFYDGKLQYEWIAGSPKGNMGKDIPYRSRKIGDEMYIVNFHEKQKPDFITLIFNLKQNVMYSSAIVKYGTDKEMTSFRGGIVEHVKR